MEKTILVGPVKVPEECRWTLDNLQTSTNPGMGGSEFQNLLLAFVLSGEFPVDIWVPGSKTANLGGIRLISKPDLKKKYALQISNTSNVNDLDDSPSCPLIAISHHPFDANLRRLDPRTIGIVNVGDYQLQSNLTMKMNVRVPSFWCPVFLPEPYGQIRRTGNNVLRVGHISSLHPSKGFHVILKGWMKYLKKGGVGKLEVIGGRSIYGLKEVHHGIPTSKKYAEKLLQIMGGEIHESVTFLGKIDDQIDPYLISWDAAIFNPSGFGESENVSMKECWRLGIPAIAGNRFGQRDYMKSEGRLRAQTARGVGKRLGTLEKQIALRQELGLKLEDRYVALYERGLASREKWINIATAVVEGKFDRILALSSPPRLGAASKVYFDKLILNTHDALGKAKELVFNNG